MNISPKWGKHLPDDADCTKIFKIKCLPEEWIERTHDFKYFKMHSSERKGLIGMRKVGMYLGNLYCPYDNTLFKFFTRWREDHSKLLECKGS